MKSLLFTLLILTTFVHADFLRVSGVAEELGKDAERMTIKYGENEDVLFVKKKIIVGDADIKKAIPNPGSEGEILVTLSEEGGKKLLAATSAMQLGKDRMAVIVNGKLLLAPTVQAKLKSSIIVAGLEDLNYRELNDLARQLSGLKPLAEDEEPERPKPLPKIETVSNTEAEYQQIKAKREIIVGQQELTTSNPQLAATSACVI